MSGPEELYPPAQYAAGWMLLAFGVLAALVLAAWLVIVLTAPRRRPAPVAAPSPPAPLFVDVSAVLRQEYLGGIARIEQRYRDGELDARRANLELSRAVRAFVNEYSGLEAPVLALEDLERAGVHPALLEALRRHYYPSVFRRGPALDPIAGAEAARRVVTTWH